MPTTPTYGIETPTVGGDADQWGDKLNEAIEDIDEILTVSANRILGRNEATEGAIEEMTGTEVTALLDAVAGAAQGSAGTKGIVPQPTAGQQNRVLGGDGTWRSDLGRMAGAFVQFAGTVTAGTIQRNLNVASASNLSAITNGYTMDVVFTNAVPTAYYDVNVTIHCNAASVIGAVGAKIKDATVNGFTLILPFSSIPTDLTGISFSVF